MAQRDDSMVPISIIIQFPMLAKFCHGLQLSAILQVLKTSKKLEISADNTLIGRREVLASVPAVPVPVAATPSVPQSLGQAVIEQVKFYFSEVNLQYGKYC